MYRYARAERVKFDNFVAALQKVNILSEETKSDNDLAKWAFNVVYTRSFGTNDEKAIVPMADMVRVCTRNDDFLAPIVAIANIPLINVSYTV